ncbi:unnamed protein product [Rangifer tarandus platyrhynchus]|uniref:Uncharacterized protein n=1 Tax=Rangifer tarandus platyrhynchus TaxID=3082113 RepID=A0AC59YFB1_RANTA
MWGRPTLCLLQLGAQSSDKSLETDCQDFKGRVPPPAGAPRCRQDHLASCTEAAALAGAAPPGGCLAIASAHVASPSQGQRSPVPFPKGNWSYLEPRLQEPDGAGEGLLGSSLCLEWGFIRCHPGQDDASPSERSLQSPGPPRFGHDCARVLSKMLLSPEDGFSSPRFSPRIVMAQDARFSAWPPGNVPSHS